LCSKEDFIILIDNLTSDINITVEEAEDAQDSFPLKPVEQEKMF
jgi:hypothetical protein